MKNSVQSVRTCLWAGILALVCLWTGCSAPKLTQVSPAKLQAQTTIYSVADAPQGAQVNQAPAYMAAMEDVQEFTASSEPVISGTAATNSATFISAVPKNSQLSRKAVKLMDKVQKQSSTDVGNATSQVKQTNDIKFAKRLLSKAERKLDITKAKQGKAAQANTTLVGLGALLAIVGLVLVLATSGTAATIGVVALAVGVILLILSLISN
jgi:hypothetical protein